MTCKKHKVLDLFSGIGGFSLGLERTGGFKTVAFCEKCPEATKVLKKHWADVPVYQDVKNVTFKNLIKDGIEFDVLTAGFPCTDISKCNVNGEGINGKKSGLWKEVARIIRDAQPKWAILENVPAIRSRGFEQLISEFDACGYMGEWYIIPASSIGAYHRRQRMFLIAYPDSNECSHTGRTPFFQRYVLEKTKRQEAPDGFVFNNTGEIAEGRLNYWTATQWLHSSPRCRMVNGVPKRLDKNRLNQLGNSLVPQIPQLIGNAILQAECERK
tara:strand:- start:1646 stop:2458 length:813 start_codon:yes stop_codon:yes gene_type:complete